MMLQKCKHSGQNVKTENGKTLRKEKSQNAHLNCPETVTLQKLPHWSQNGKSWLSFHEYFVCWLRRDINIYLSYCCRQFIPVLLYRSNIQTCHLRTRTASEEKQHPCKKREGFLVRRNMLHYSSSFHLNLRLQPQPFWRKRYGRNKEKIRLK